MLRSCSYVRKADTILLQWERAFTLADLDVSGELALVFAMAITIMFFFVFSHSKSNLMPATLPKKPGWPQPRDQVRNWVEQHNMYAARAASKGEVKPPLPMGSSCLRSHNNCLITRFQTACRTLVRQSLHKRQYHPCALSNAACPLEASHCQKIIREYWQQ